MLSAGGEHTCGITTAGEAWCWGFNYSGQLGNGTEQSSTEPVPVSGSFEFSVVSAGRDHTCGVTLSAVAYCWGKNLEGQLGNGGGPASNVPVRVGMSRVNVR